MEHELHLGHELHELYELNKLHFGTLITRIRQITEFYMEKINRYSSKLSHLLIRVISVIRIFRVINDFYFISSYKCCTNPSAKPILGT